MPKVPSVVVPSASVIDFRLLKMQRRQTVVEIRTVCKPTTTVMVTEMATVMVTEMATVMVTESEMVMEVVK